MANACKYLKSKFIVSVLISGQKSDRTSDTFCFVRADKTLLECSPAAILHHRTSSYIFSLEFMWPMCHNVSKQPLFFSPSPSPSPFRALSLSLSLYSAHCIHLRLHVSQEFTIPFRVRPRIPSTVRFRQWRLCAREYNYGDNRDAHTHALTRTHARVILWCHNVRDAIQYDKRRSEIRNTIGCARRM